MRESTETKTVIAHFLSLAAVERERLDLEKYYNSRHEAGMVEAIVEITQSASLPPRTIYLDGFIPKHVNVSQGEDGIISIFGVFSRRAPYIWPRTLDIMLGPGSVARIDLDDHVSSEVAAVYRLNSDTRLEMKSPNGQYTWAVTKDKLLMTSLTCLYRQDLYKDGEWIKSLVAIANPSVRKDPSSE